MTASELLRSVCHARSALAWCAEYARDGDPLPAAWAACDEPHAMLAALGRSHDLWWRAYHAWVEMPHHGPPGSLCGSFRRHACPPCADAIRVAVPTITAAEVL